MPEHLPAPTPHRAVYGFALYFLFTTVFIIYICWVFIPQYILEVNAGLFYLPDKYFAHYIPVLLLTGTTAFAFFIYPSINLIITPEVAHMCTISDSAAIHRCCFKNINGSYCDNIIDVSSNEIWPADKLCLCHKSKRDNVRELDFAVNFNICDCSPNNNCYLTKKKNWLVELKTRNKIAPVRDLYIEDVCNEIFDGFSRMFLFGNLNHNGSSLR